MSERSEACYALLVAASLPAEEAEALGIRLYREGWRQTSNRYRMVSLSTKTLELDLLTFKAFKAEGKRAWETNALCLSAVTECTGGEVRKLGAFLSRKRGAALMCAVISEKCQPRPGVDL